MPGPCAKCWGCCNEQDSQGHCCHRTLILVGEITSLKKTNEMISNRRLNNVKKMKLSNGVSRETTLYREVKESLSKEVTFDLRVG